MSPRRSDSRERMLRSTVALLSEYGAGATSIDRVLAHSGAPRGSVYHHFPGGRGQLVDEAVTTAGDVISGLIEAAVAGGDPLRSVDAFFALWRGRLLDSEFRAGCPVVAVAVETNDDAPHLARSAAAVFARWNAALAELFVRHGLPAGRARRLAAFVVASVEGAVVMCRVERSIAPLDAAAGEIHDLLAHALRRPEPGRSPSEIRPSDPLSQGAAMPTLDRQDDVFILDLGDNENRFHPDWLASVNALLDEVEKTEGPRALVTAATGKFWSNGLDLDWLFAHADQAGEYVTGVQTLFARVLTLPMATVAALQGHTFAAGAMLSLAHDFRVMRADRGFWCLPEADINIPFTPGMSALIQARLHPQTAHEAMTTARRYGGDQALAERIVDRTAGEHEVREAAVALARPLAGKAGPTLGTIKTRMYGPALEALRQKDVPLG